MLLEEAEAFGGEGDTAFGRPGRGGQVGEAAGAGALERAPDAGRSGGEVEVFPVEGEEFAFTEAGAEGEFVQRVEPVGAGFGRDADVLGGESRDLLGAEAGDEVKVDAGGIAGVGVLADPRLSVLGRSQSEVAAESHRSITARVTTRHPAPSVPLRSSTKGWMPLDKLASGFRSQLFEILAGGRRK